MAMTRDEFKRRWEKDEDGDGITFDEVADCAEAWGLFVTPRIHRIDVVRYAVLKEAGVENIDEFRPTM